MSDTAGGRVQRGLNCKCTVTTDDRRILFNFVSPLLPAVFDADVVENRHYVVRHLLSHYPVTHILCVRVVLK